MRFHILASGSTGNCTFIDCNGTGLLIDCGISRKQVIYRLKEAGYDISDIRYVFLTHDHTDHKKNIHIFPDSIIYSPEGCYDHLAMDHYLKPYDILDFSAFQMIPLKTSHDATNSVGFEIICGAQRLIYMTDTGYVSRKNASYMKNADYYIIESNHDIPMLMATSRPMSVKNRILSDQGHLSNQDSALLMTRLVGDKTKEIVLAHLSQEANTPAKALETYQSIFAKYEIDLDRIAIKIASPVALVSGGQDEN